MRKFYKILGVLVLVFIAACCFFYFQFQPSQTTVWGINFSQIRARELGLNARELFLDMLTDLKPKEIRMAAYWTEIEPQENVYNFTELDDLLKQAEIYHTDVILAVGNKLPRWPECYKPDWAKQLDPAQEQTAQLSMVKTVVEHYKNFPAITVWQVENEGLFGFGLDCPKIDKDLFRQEISLVKSLDTRPVLVTDSGEIGRWLPTASLGADWFGSTMYRVVENNLTGYIKYPLPYFFFRIKAGIINTFARPQKIIGVELQAEPWLSGSVQGTDLDTQKAMMNPKIFQQNVAFAQKVGFSENYLWGVEWWYWMAKKQNDWGMWQSVKDLLAK
ncbi:MAG TPA: beta-galactosidase [Methylomirabilota bacterium]|nr:beta-galactosidase [Methylomirabilota bacterium]